MKMWPTMRSDAHLAHSSVGQSSGLIIRRSWDHAPLGPPETHKQIAYAFLIFIPDRSLTDSGYTQTTVFIASFVV